MYYFQKRKLIFSSDNENISDCISAYLKGNSLGGHSVIIFGNYFYPYFIRIDFDQIQLI